jgi:hypothetical protein
MTPDDETLMAYADGELDAVSAKRVERAIAEDPALAARVEAHRKLRTQLAMAFPLGGTPDPLEAMIRAAPVAIAPRPAAAWRRSWNLAGAMAACLVVGLLIGSHWESTSVKTGHDGALIASGTLAHALDTQLTGIQGETRILVTFRDTRGNYCRVFSAPAVDGIACRDDRQWRLVRTGTNGEASRSEYRQAGSSDMAMMAAAQEMMAHEVTPAEERNASTDGWRRGK